MGARVVRECVVCLSAAPNTHLLPCNHAILCHHWYAACTCSHIGCARLRLGMNAIRTHD
jgi:hypothetical protein